MSARKEPIVRHSAADLLAKSAAGETKSDWARAAAAPQDVCDADDAIDPIDWGTTELRFPRPKRMTHIRLDADMVDWFKEQGPGYQTRINAVLRSYFEQMRGR